MNLASSAPIIYSTRVSRGDSNPDSKRPRVASRVILVYFRATSVLFIYCSYCTVNKTDIFNIYKTMHRRRIKIEENAKVVAQFHAALAIFQWTIWIKGWIAPGRLERKEWINPILQNRSAVGKELNKFFPPNRSDNLCLFFCIYPSSMFPHL